MHGCGKHSFCPFRRGFFKRAFIRCFPPLLLFSREILAARVCVDVMMGISTPFCKVQKRRGRASWGGGGDRR